jgi:DDE superfamily endonuclease/Winged helix-turn helix
VSYHPEHVRKILKGRLGWTSQKPRRKARERNDKEVERWKADDLPRILGRACRRRAHVLLLDESGFQLTPSLRRTLAPRGRRPALEAWDRRDRISAIRCISLLKELRAQRCGPFTVVWDRHGIHGKSRLVKAYLAEHPEVVAEDFPGYAPDLNPDEWVWSWAKYGKLSDLAAMDTEELWEHLVDAPSELKFPPKKLKSFVLAAGLRDAA